MEPRKAVGWLAALVIVGAVLAGFLPVHANDVSCGAAFSSGSSDAGNAQFGDDIADAMSGRNWNTIDYGADCADRRSTQRAFTIPLLIVGALVGGYLILTNSPEEKAAAARRSEDDELVDED